MQTADRSRMTIVRLGKEVDHWPSVQAGILSTMKLADKIRWRIIRRTPEIVAAVVRRIAVFEEYGMSSREARASAVLTVGWHEWALDQSSDHDVYAQEADREDIPDGVQLLNEILALQIHLEAGRAPTLLEALRSKSSADLDESVVDRFGVKRNLVDRGKREDGALAIFAEHDGLSTALSRAGSRFANVNRRELLEQIEGAGPSENALRFGGRRKQGVLIPSEVLMRFGIFITDPPDAETGTAPPEPTARRILMGRVTECQQMSVILSRSRARNHHHFIYKSSSSSVLRACDTGDTGKKVARAPARPPAHHAHARRARGLLGGFYVRDGSRRASAAKPLGCGKHDTAARPKMRNWTGDSLTFRRMSAHVSSVSNRKENDR